MKKFLLAFTALIISNGVMKSQCVGACTLYSQSSIPFAPNPTTGNSVVLGDDQLSTGFPIGFTFTFFCNAYTTFYISSNGFISFNGAAYNGCCSGGFLPTAGSNPDNLIASLWTDLYPPSGGSITYSTSGTAPNRVLTVSWTGIQYYYATGSTTHQIKLFETSNNIEIHSTSASVDGHIKTQGILNSGGTIGQSTPGRNSNAFSIATPDAYQFVMGGGNTATPPAAILGSVSICPGSSYVYSVAPLAGATSYNWALPGGWTGASSTNTILATPGASGVMSVSATYTCGTSNNTTLNITVNPVPVVTIAGGTSPICAGSSIVLTASGANTYSWNTGPTTAAITIAPGVNTSYTVLGTSAAGCTATAVRNVTVTPGPVVTITGPTQLCLNNTITLTGNGADTYTWSNAATTQTISVSPAANITYTVTGTNTLSGCTGTASQAVTVNPLPVIGIAGGFSLCTGSTLTLTAVGASTYTWNIGPTTNTVAISPLINTTYSVTGTNVVTGCTNSNSIAITVNSLPTVSISGPTVACINQAISLAASGANTYSWSNGNLTATALITPTANASYSVVGTSAAGCTASAVQGVSVSPGVTITVSGNTQICLGGSSSLTAGGADTYTWSNGFFTPGISVTPTTNTTYTVTGTNTLTGCFASTVIPVTVNPLPVISVAGVNTICLGSSAFLTASGANTYTWDFGPTTNTVSVSPLVNTTYSVIGTNAVTGCSAMATEPVTVNPIPTVAISGPTAICVGQSASLTAMGANNYSWSNGSTFAGISVAPGVTTTYSVIGTSAAGCTASASQTLTVNPNPTISITGNTSICQGNPGVLNGNGATNYTWSTGGTVPSITIAPAANTIYTVFGVNNLTGCSGTANITVIVNTAPVVNITGNSTICAGTTVNLLGSGANTYSWSTGATVNPVPLTPGVTTTYSVVGTNTVTGCSSMAAYIVTVSPAPTLTVTGPYAMCITQTITEAATGAVTYTWSTGSNFSSISISPTVSTTYSVVGTNSMGCVGPPYIKNIIVNMIPVVTASASSIDLCRGQSATLTAGGVNTYSWTNGALTNTTVVTPVNTTTYSVIGTNTTTGCYNTPTLTIYVTVCTGIATQVSNPEMIKLYPNPNSGTFMIEMANGLKKNYEIWDMTGRLVKADSGSDDTINVDISEYANGVYYVKVKCEEALKIIKLIKE